MKNGLKEVLAMGVVCILMYAILSIFIGGF